MPAGVWLGVVVIGAWLLVMAYFGFLAVRALVRARREAMAEISIGRSADVHAALAEVKAEAAAAKRRTAPKRGGAGERRVGRMKEARSTSTDREVEEALAQLEGQKRRRRRNMGERQQDRRSGDAEHRSTGATGDPSGGSPGGGA